jgi:hypothetical protein
MGAYATAELHLVNGALLTGTWALALLVVGALTALPVRAGCRRPIGAD